MNLSNIGYRVSNPSGLAAYFSKTIEIIKWNAKMKIEFRPIGIVHSPFKEQQGTPIQPVFAEIARGKVEIFEPYRAALKDLSGFSRV
jgi:hypothetical protein